MPTSPVHLPPPVPPPRVFPLTRTLVGLLIALLLGGGILWLMQRSHQETPIKIGVLHSLTGIMAVSEAPLVAAVRLAVQEINATGGLLGHPLEAVIADGRSDPAVFAREAERLITEEHVSALFACWTSACRQAVKPVVEQHQHLLFYPLQYEGFEQSPNIIYTGAAPNQQIVPGTRWVLQKFGHSVYLVGSDYVFSRTANRIIRDLVDASGGTVLAEHYLPLGSHTVAPVMEELRRQRPTVILNTLNGDSNAAFFDSLVAAGLSDLPIISFSVAEPEMLARQGARLTRHYAVWNYFQSLPGERNRRFIDAFRQLAGPDAATSDPVEAAYAGVHLWANAVRALGQSNPSSVNTAALLRQSFAGPSGIISIDAHTRHVWKHVRIGQIGSDGQFHQIYASHRPIRPAPWPSYRSRAAWREMLENTR